MSIVPPTHDMTHWEQVSPCHPSLQEHEQFSLTYPLEHEGGTVQVVTSGVLGQSPVHSFVTQE